MGLTEFGTVQKKKSKGLLPATILRNLIGPKIWCREASSRGRCPGKTEEAAQTIIKGLVKPKSIFDAILCGHHKNGTGRYNEHNHRASNSTNYGSYCKGMDIKLTRVLEQNCTTDYELISTEVIKS